MKLKKKKHRNTVKIPLNHFQNENVERMAVLEMLLWKYNIQGIPQPVFKRLVDNGFMVKKYGGFVWTEVTDEIGKVFNETFNYK